MSIVKFNEPLRLAQDFAPKGDQATAIAGLVEGLESGYRFQTLLGATGTGKTYTMASVINETQRPALILAHNKTLAAQLCQEFRAFFPENSVQYFISYYDYYQPEAYVPGADLYIEKDSSVNDEIERLRHAATHALLERRDVIVVASVSCIYGLGSPSEYAEAVITFETNGTFDLDEALKKLVAMQFSRNEVALDRGTFRVRGDTLEIQPKDEEIVTRVEFFGDTVERIRLFDPLTGEVIDEPTKVSVFPATHYVTPWERMEDVLEMINAEKEAQCELFVAQGKLLEAQRLRQRVDFDVEMMKEVGYCNGIENYSRYFDGRAPGTPPYTLLDFLPSDAIIFVDESHQTLPQVRAMFNGDKARKSILVDYGFRLPSALDNRPLKFEEFLERVPQVVYVSATPGPFEQETQSQIVEQIIRPTYVVDPEIDIRPTKGQIDDLIGEIQKRVERGERTLVTTLTKKMSEDLTGYLQDLNVKVQYIHSNVHSLERPEILRDLRLGVYDVIVGVNLLREGLDLPEVTLVAILDADKEGFLRSETSLIQTIGRAARNAGGRVIMYADNITGSMQRAIDETDRRRETQRRYNEEHGTLPQTVNKMVRETVRSYESVKEVVDQYSAETRAKLGADGGAIRLDELPILISNLERDMKDLAKAMEFEKAAQVRDEIESLRALMGTSSGRLGQDKRRVKRFAGKR
ncbi:excinuclease ABC subunit UvrB [Fimbriimonas ginsengisoli]|uniref:UvrABC system protein B n=1 Tax=Fimbriimonas ginsengisoli Gsoil 348 TaxID=661478 RepID=A0A068NRK2_FIMGI|nr:excinuclease ABC subunit UvrB [Fimbriimonas ginsengisoli]AIE84239.1 excinuclease ABC subunit B [Fimbriimonas ginsengisoli Gsoil 348]